MDIASLHTWSGPEPREPLGPVDMKVLPGFISYHLVSYCHFSLLPCSLIGFLLIRNGGGSSTIVLETQAN